MAKRIVGIVIGLGAIVLAAALYGFVLAPPGRSGQLSVAAVVEGMVLGLAASVLWLALRDRGSAFVALAVVALSLLAGVFGWSTWWLDPVVGTPVGWLAMTVVLVRLAAYERDHRLHAAAARDDA